MLHALGAHAVALPVGEAMLARRLLAFAGARGCRTGLIGLAPRAIGTLEFERGDSAAAHFTGALTACRGAGNCEFVVAVVERETTVHM